MSVEEALAIVAQILEPERLTKVQKLVFRYAWEGKSYEEIAKVEDYGVGYLKDAGSRLWQSLSEKSGERVSKLNLQSVVARLAQQVTPSTNQSIASPATRCDWGDAPDATHFHGRQTELATLQQWIVEEHCRLIAVLGMGGIGKTAIAVKLAEQVQSQFNFVIWRSLRNAPPFDTLIAQLILFLSNQQEVELPQSVDAQLDRVLHYLRSARCLIILDNIESILRPRERAGRYRQGYESYGQLIRQVADGQHSSCLILTSREKPSGLSTREGTTLPVRSLQLSGVGHPEAQRILKPKGLATSPSNFQQLIDQYGGNPLALKIVATTIQSVFGGNVAEFLNQSAIVFGDLWDLLDQQFQRLSALEQQIMYWLAINREPTTIAQLREDIVPVVSHRELIEAIESLQARSLIEQSVDVEVASTSFTQQPAVMEYMTERLVSQFHREIATQDMRLLKTHTLIKAQTKDYIRDSQIRTILEPLTHQLEQSLQTLELIKQRLDQLLLQVRSQDMDSIEYEVGNLINLLNYLKIDLSNYDFSHLKISQAYLQNANLQRANFSHARFVNSVFAETLGGVLSVAFSPDGTHLANAEATGEIRVWQLAESQQVLSFQAHSRWVHTITYSPDGQILATGSIDPFVKLWNAHTGECLQTLQGHTHPAWAVAFSPDGQILASGGLDQTVRIWDVQTGACIQTLAGHTGCVWAIAFSSDGSTIASGSEDSTLKLWDVSTGVCRQTLQGHTSAIVSVAIHPNDNTIITSSQDQTVRIWDVPTRVCLQTLQGHTDQVWAVALSPDGRTITSGSHDNTVRIWDVASGQCLRALIGHTSRVLSVAFDPSGRTIASGSSDQSVKQWNWQTGHCLKTLQGSVSIAIQSVAFCPTPLSDSPSSFILQPALLLASGSENGTISLWNTQTGECLNQFKAHAFRVIAVASSPNGRILASGSDDHTVKLWDLPTGQLLQTLEGHEHQIRTVAFHPTGQLLASGSSDRTIRIWDTQTGECLKIFSAHSGWVLSVAFSPDGLLLASGSSDNTIKLWQIESGECLTTLAGHTNFVTSVAFSADGQRLASSGSDQEIRLWDIATGECLQLFQGHTNLVWAVVFSADGQTLISSSSDQTVKLWKVQSGECRQTLQGHSKGVLSVALSSDQQTIASSSEDETIKLWNFSTGECQMTLRSDRLYEGAEITNVQGLTDKQKTTLKLLGAVEHPLQ